MVIWDIGALTIEYSLSAVLLLIQNHKIGHAICSLFYNKNKKVYTEHETLLESLNNNSPLYSFFFIVETKIESQPKARSTLLKIRM